MSSKLKSLNTFFKSAPDEENIFHWIAIVLIYMAVFVVLGTIAWFEKQHLILTLEYASGLLTIVGAIWTGAGVNYVRPKPFTNIEKLSKHVIVTFANASRHFTVGIAIILLGYMCLLASKNDWIKSLV